MGKSYHPECFHCTTCGISLDELPFTIDIHGCVYCIPDYVRSVFIETISADEVAVMSDKRVVKSEMVRRSGPIVEF